LMFLCAKSKEDGKKHGICLPQFIQNASPKLPQDELNAEKMKNLGKFASIVSHDLKNPLASLKNISYYFTNSVKLDGEVPNKMLKMFSSEVDRMNKIIVEFLDMTRIKQLNPAVSDLDVLINEVVEKEKDDKINFNLNLANYKANVDPERFKQVISSLIKNSKDAMAPEGGAISVNMSEAEGGAVVIEITDTGKGMDAETLDKCFDPMFTTKTTKAMGMSLAVSKQIINMSDGAIKAENCPDKGVKVTIILPLAR
ncbi:MAG: ATP-binding protein, partial [Endomicrobia bacterium]|nr:ATP-binding protein [Endomicrobiia bacterium]